VSAAGGYDVAAGGPHVNPSSVGVRRGLQPARLKVDLDTDTGGDPDGVRRRDSKPEVSLRSGELANLHGAKLLAKNPNRSGCRPMMIAANTLGTYSRVSGGSARAR
jgi:hypothetical protein